MLLDIAGGTEQNHFTADRLEAQGLGEWDPQSRKLRISRSIKMHMVVSINGGTPLSLNALFHGKSPSKIDDLGVPLF